MLSKAKQARADVLAHWTWDVALDVVESRLQAIRTRNERPERTRRSLSVQWQGDQYQVHSLAQVNREIAHHLISDGDLDVELSSREIDPDPGLVAGLSAAHVWATGRVLDRAPDVMVRHQWPPDWSAPERGAWVMIQPWEFGAVPQSWIDGSHDVDQIWCYTNWVKECYELSGFPAERLRVLPLGVDVELFTPEGAESTLLRTSKTTRLLFCGGAISRKGIDVLIDSYLAAFSRADDVCLVIKAHGSTTSYAGQNVVHQIRALAQRTDLPEIELIDEDLSPEDLAALYRSCDVLVHPYRGEGFGLPVLEAMACGLPVVVTAGAATSDFCDETTAYAIPAELVPVEVGGEPSAQAYFWAEPDVEALSRLLREVVDDPAGRAERGRRGRERAVSRWTWQHTAQATSALLHEVAASVPLRERPVRNLDTRSGSTVLHVVGGVDLREDEVVTSYLARVAAGSDACLVLAVVVGTVDGARVLEQVQALAAGNDTAEVLLVHCAEADLVQLRSQVRWLSDEVVFDGGVLARTTAAELSQTKGR